MKVSVGIDQYVHHRNQTGYLFENGWKILRAFSRRSGDIELAEVSALQVLSYLDEGESSTTTWRIKYGILSRFFTFWSDRDETPAICMPPARPKVHQTFKPHIFSKVEIRSLLRLAKRNDRRQSVVAHQVLKALIVLLYGTGISVGEAMNLECTDVDLSKELLHINTRSVYTTRVIPIGKDLYGHLRKYLAWRSRRGHVNTSVFLTKDGRSISRRRLNMHFYRLCKLANVRSCKDVASLPRMMDLRYAFAVHRITSWLKGGADLNRMLPALAAYMGQVGLGATDRYLSWCAERHRKDLDKLSPRRGKYRWRNDKELMKFLAEL